MKAWDLFQGCLGLIFVGMLACMAAAGAVWWQAGDLSTAQAERLLGILYLGYPLIFTALAALTWHFVQSYRGAYA